MTLTRLNIPKKIHVGFQNRDGTYTGKLAFVVREDAKGKKSCERSWNNWRDKNIPSECYDNEPTSGFVLNKKVGDYSSRWGGRRAWIRIYDPRGFEFEIGVENLLFILQECSAIKGKGLEGEFIYSWDGKNIVLLPVTSQEYKESVKATRLRAGKVTKADMVEGCIYKTKEGLEMMYLGRHPWHWRYVTKDRIEGSRRRRPNSNYWSSYIYDFWQQVKHSSKKQHIFVSMDGKYSEPTRRYDETVSWSRDDTVPYWVQPGFTKLGERLTTEPDPRYADEYDKLMQCKFIKGFGEEPAPKKVTAPY